MFLFHLGHWDIQKCIKDTHRREFPGMFQKLARTMAGIILRRTNDNFSFTLINVLNLSILHSFYHAHIYIQIRRAVLSNHTLEVLLPFSAPPLHYLAYTVVLSAKIEWGKEQFLTNISFHDFNNSTWASRAQPLSFSSSLLLSTIHLNYLLL